MSAKRLKYALITVLISLSMISISQTMTGKLAVGPLSLIFQLEQGETTTKDISIHNTGDESIQVNLDFDSWWRKPDKKEAEKVLERECSEWVLFSPSSLSLDPDERGNVSVQLAVPEGVSGDHWAMLMVSEKPQPVEEEQPVTTRLSISYGIKILQKDPLNRVKEAKITKIQLIQKNPLHLEINYSNTGSAHLQTTGKVEIRNLQGETVKKFKIDKFPTLPGESRELEVGGKEGGERLEPGQYYAIAVMDFGGDHLIQGGLPINIPKG